MSVFTSAIYNRLVGDSDLVGMLATYKGSPAVFTVDPVPGDAVMPYIVASGPVADIPFDTKITTGREVTTDIRCYCEDNGSMIPVVGIAEKVRELFHRQKINVTGYKNIITECTGLVFAPESGVLGMVVTVRFVFERG